MVAINYLIREFFRLGPSVLIKNLSNFLVVFFDEIVSFKGPQTTIKVRGLEIFGLGTEKGLALKLPLLPEASESFPRAIRLLGLILICAGSEVFFGA